MKTKDRQAARAKAKLPWRRPEADDDAPEVLDWFEKWAQSHQQDESNNNYRSQE